MRQENVHRRKEVSTMKRAMLTVVVLASLVIFVAAVMVAEQKAPAPAAATPVARSIAVSLKRLTRSRRAFR